MATGYKEEAEVVPWSWFVYTEVNEREKGWWCVGGKGWNRRFISNYIPLHLLSFITVHVFHIKKTIYFKKTTYTEVEKPFIWDSVYSPPEIMHANDSTGIWGSPGRTETRERLKHNIYRFTIPRRFLTSPQKLGKVSLWYTSTPQMYETGRR